MKSLRMWILGAAFVALPAWAGQSGLPAAQSLDIGKMTCKQLMRGNDADRDAGLAYFNGYFAGKKNSMVIDAKAMTELTDRVKDFCLSNPTSTVLDAFAKVEK
jgi:HdeA/HdeB family